jgi:hypothetical protein
MCEYCSAGDFPTMGESIASSVVNMSRGSRYTTTMVKNGSGKRSQPSGRKANRSASLIHEANGPACTIKATLYAPNAAESSATERNVKIMKSSVGNRDFWDARARTGQ